MYRIYLCNFGYYLEPEFKSVHDAIKFGKSKGFDFSVHGKRETPFTNANGKKGTQSWNVMSWSIFGGEKWYRGEFDKEFSQFD